MSIEIAGQAITFRPTPWKWYVLAGIIVALLPVLGVFAALLGGFALLQAIGKMTWVRFDREGITASHFFRKKAYRWDDIQDFRIQTLRINVFYPVRNLVFSRKDKAGTTYGKLSRFVAGGTEAVSVPNGKWQEMLAAAQAFSLGAADVLSFPAPTAQKAKQTAAAAVQAAPPQTPLVQEGGWGLFRKDRATLK